MRTPLLLGLVAVTMTATACSSSNNDPFGPDPDFTTIQSSLQRPTGTFARGSEVSIIGASQSQKTSDGFPMGGFAAPSGTATASGSGAGSTAGGTTTASMQMQSLRILGGPSSTSTWCPAISTGDGAGSCSCPGGGSLAYDFSGVDAVKARAQTGATGPVDVTLRVHADQCTVQGITIDGGEYVKVESAGTPSASDLFMLLVVRLGVRIAASPDEHRLDVDALYDDGKFWVAVRVDDGVVVVSSDTGWDSATKTGTIYVKDKNATWTCTLTNGAGQCTSNTGETRQVGGG